MKDEKIYVFGKSNLILKFGDITPSTADVIVSSDDINLSMGGGVSAAIHRVGGEAIVNDAKKLIPCHRGDVVVTSSGNLNSKYIFHAITIDWSNHDDIPTDIIVKNIINRSFNILDTLDLKSIAFPAIGTGAAKYCLEDVAHSMAVNISSFLLNSNKEFNVYIYLLDRFNKLSPIDYSVFFEQFYRRMFSAGINIVEAKTTEIKSEKDTIDTKAIRLNHLNSYLLKLEEQRINFENKLIVAIEKSDNEWIQTLNTQLEENNKIRYSCMSEIKEIEGTEMLEREYKSVFLSSTFEDLRDFRRAVIDRIIKRKMVPVCMEYWGASSTRASSVVVDEVKKADIYLGVFGQRYGYIDNNSNMSMTEIEYREALALNKPILVYISKDVKEESNEFDNKQKLLNLLTEIEKERTVYYFNNSDQLGEQVFADLEKYVKK